MHSAPNAMPRSACPLPEAGRGDHQSAGRSSRSGGAGLWSNTRACIMFATDARAALSDVQPLPFDNALKTGEQTNVIHVSHVLPARTERSVSPLKGSIPYSVPTPKRTSLKKEISNPLPASSHLFKHETRTAIVDINGWFNVQLLGWPLRGLLLDG